MARARRAVRRVGVGLFLAGEPHAVLRDQAEREARIERRHGPRAVEHERRGAGDQVRVRTRHRIEQRRFLGRGDRHVAVAVRMRQRRGCGPGARVVGGAGGGCLPGRGPRRGPCQGRSSARRRDRLRRRGDHVERDQILRRCPCRAACPRSLRAAHAASPWRPTSRDVADAEPLDAALEAVEVALEAAPPAAAAGRDASIALSARPASPASFVSRMTCQSCCSSSAMVRAKRRHTLRRGRRRRGALIARAAARSMAATIAGDPGGEGGGTSSCAAPAAAAGALRALRSFFQPCSRPRRRARSRPSPSA